MLWKHPFSVTSWSFKTVFIDIVVSVLLYLKNRIYNAVKVISLGKGDYFYCVRKVDELLYFKIIVHNTRAWWFCIYKYPGLERPRVFYFSVEVYNRAAS